MLEYGRMVNPGLASGFVAALAKPAGMKRAVR